MKTDTYKDVPGQEDSGEIASEFCEYIRDQARKALRALVEEGGSEAVRRLLSA